MVYDEQVREGFERDSLVALGRGPAPHLALIVVERLRQRWSARRARQHQLPARIRFHAEAQGQTTENFLDLIERLAPEILRPQHLRFRLPLSLLLLPSLTRNGESARQAISECQGSELAGYLWASYEVPACQQPTTLKLALASG